jgi:hypothetical protein
MTYSVKLRDKTVLGLDDKNAEDLKLRLASSKQTIMVEIGDTLMRSTEILSIQRNQQTEADIPNFDIPVLPSGKVCRATYSIQAEINKIALDEGGKEWGKLIRDKKWRETTRLKLRESNVSWCDYKEGECACI